MVELIVGLDGGFFAMGVEQNKKKKKREGKEGGFFVASMAFFCVVLAEAPRQLLRIDTHQQKANRETRSPVFGCRPQITFCSVFLLNFLVE